MLLCSTTIFVISSFKVALFLLIFVVFVIKKHLQSYAKRKFSSEANSFAF